MANALISKEEILIALRKVMDPDLKQDLVTLGMIRDLEVFPGGEVTLRVVLTTPACPVKAQLEAEVKRQIATVVGVNKIRVKMDAEVRSGIKQNLSGKIEGVSHVIAVSSGKGGVGKSTVAANLAVALAKTGARVGLLDADIYGPNIPTMLGVTEPPMMEVDSVKGEVIIPAQAHGIQVMSMGFLIKGDQPVVWRGPMLHNVLSQFCHKVKWGALDYLVMDLPPGTGDVQLSLAQLIPISGVVMVTTPQEVAMQDVRRAFHMFEKVRVPVIGLVENMSYFVCDSCEKRHFLFGEDGGKALAQKFTTELLEQVPLVPSIRQGGDQGRPAVTQAGSVAEAFERIAAKVAQKLSIMSHQANLPGASAGPSAEIEIGKF